MSCVPAGVFAGRHTECSFEEQDSRLRSHLVRGMVSAQMQGRWQDYGHSSCNLGFEFGVETT